MLMSPRLMGRIGEDTMFPGKLKPWLPRGKSRAGREVSEALGPETVLCKHQRDIRGLDLALIYGACRLPRALGLPPVQGTPSYSAGGRSSARWHFGGCSFWSGNSDIPGGPSSNQTPRSALVYQPAFKNWWLLSSRLAKGAAPSLSDCQRQELLACLRPWAVETDRPPFSCQLRLLESSDRCVLCLESSVSIFQAFEEGSVGLSRC